MHGNFETKLVVRAKGLTGEIEWYTPRQYLDAAIAVMGCIDLDPASSAKAQRHVKANQYYTKRDDGLRQRWFGRVFLNPPYAMPYIKQFSARIVDAYQRGEISEGILLTNNSADTKWFQSTGLAASAICWTAGRIHFLAGRDRGMVVRKSPMTGQAFFYFGNNPQKFSLVFSQYGMVR